MKKAHLLPLFLLVILAVLFRTVWHFGDNIEFVTTATIIASVYFGLTAGMVVPFFAMFLSDFIIGNTNIFIFTWSAYLLLGLFSFVISGRNRQSSWKNVLKGVAMAATGSVWFYLWTNFGVWLLDAWGMYPKTPAGLFQSYIMGFPFFRANLTGSIFFAAVSFATIESFRYYWKIYKSVNRKVEHNKDV